MTTGRNELVKIWLDENPEISVKWVNTKNEYYYYKRGRKVIIQELEEIKK